MKKIFLFFIYTLIFSTAYADKTPLFDSFINVKTFVADFNQENKYQGLDSYSLSGTTYVIRGKKAIWDYKEPVEYYILTPGRVEHYSEELNQLLVVNANPDDSDDPVSMLLTLFLDTSHIKSKFNILESGDTVLISPVVDQELKSIIFNFKNGLITRVVTEDSSGNSTEINFYNVKYNDPIPDSVFNKEVPDGVDIVE